jgi:hypothetical protein
MFDFSYRIGCAFCVGESKTDFSARVRSILMHTGQDVRCSAIAAWMASTSAANAVPAGTAAMSGFSTRLQQSARRSRSRSRYGQRSGIIKVLRSSPRQNQKEAPLEPPLSRFTPGTREVPVAPPGVCLGTARLGPTTIGYLATSPPSQPPHGSSRNAYVSSHMETASLWVGV